MDVLDAAYCTGRDYPGGAEQLAGRLAWPNLSDELNPNRRSAKLGLQTAVDMQLLSGDYRILYAMAVACGHFPPIPMPTDEASEEPCFKALALVAGQFSVLVQEVTSDLGDDQVTDAELRRIERAWAKLMSQGQRMLNRISAKNAELRSRRPGAQG